MKRAIFPLSLSLISLPSPSYANTVDINADDAIQSLPTMVLKADQTVDEDKKYAATTASSVLRSKAALFETAQSISVVTQEQMQEKQVKSVVDALDGVAGVSAGQYGRRGWDDFIIRGQISSAQTYVDGLRTQTSTNVLRSEDISGIDAVQVVKGPTSVGFGMTLPGGLVNLTTKRPEAESFYRANLSYGSYASKDATFDINYAPNQSKKGAFRLVGHVSDQNDPTDYVYFKNQYVAGSYNFDLNDQNDLSVIASYQHRKYIRNQGIPQNYQNYGRNVFIGEPDRYYDVDVYRVGSNFTHYFDNGWMFKQNFAVTKSKSWSNSVFAASGSSFPVVKRQINYQDKQDTNLALDNYLQRNFKSDHIDYEMTVGLDMMRERSDYYQRVDNVNALDFNDLKYGISSITEGKPSWNLTYSQYAGLYLRNLIKIDDRWILSLSGRHDWSQVRIKNRIANTDTQNSDNAFTGNASLMYRLNDYFAPYISYSTSFMPVTDAGENGTLLNPEKGKQAEIGVKFQALDQRLQGYVAYYDLTRRNVTETDSILGYSVQTGEQKTKGFETELSAALTNQWNVSFAYSYIPTAKITESLTASEVGKLINHVPKNAASLSSQYYFSPDKLGWHIGGGVTLQGERTAQRAAYYVHMPSYTLFNVNAGYEAKHWGAGLSIKNLFDKDYIQGTTPNAQLLSFGSPRTLVFNVNFKY